MRKFLSIAFALAAASLHVSAALPSSGYYRVQNTTTQRYAYVIDNTGRLDIPTTTYDLQAIKLLKGLDNAIYDPASVLYVESEGGANYDVQAQGTGIYSMIGSYMGLVEYRDGTFLAYGVHGGLTKYIGDGETGSADLGLMCVDPPRDQRAWSLLPIESAGSNYFGIKPDIAVSGKNYATMYASFPFSAYSSGIKFYTITLVDNGMAVKKEITGTVPGATPVLIECNSSVSDNRLNVGGSGSSVGTNLMKGVYFDNSMPSHYNRVPYDASTMRVLGKCSDGKIGFVKASIEFLPANKAYIVVPAGSPDEIRIVTLEEYESVPKVVNPTGITLSATSTTLYKGDTFTVTATVAPDDATDKTVTWTSANNDIATVSNGKITAVGAGTTTVTAATVNGIKATVSVEVRAKAESIKVEPSEKTMNAGEKLLFTATVLPADAYDKSVSWTSSDTSVATVDANGNVTAVADGSAMITATTADGTSLSASATVKVITLVEKIELDPTYVDAVEGDEFSISATVYPANATDRTLIWRSSDESVATVDDNGNVKVIKNRGYANISATAADGSGVTAYCRVMSEQHIVKATGISVTPETYEGVEGSEFVLTAAIEPENVTVKDVVWTTSNSFVAKVDTEGKVSIIGKGFCKITAHTTDGTRLTAVCEVNGLSGVDDIIADGATAVVYNLRGVEVMRDATAADLKLLPKGIYIVNGRKVVL